MAVPPLLGALALAAGASAAPPVGVIYNYDLAYTLNLTAAARYEHTHTVAALGGLANRGGPALYTPLVEGNPVDDGSSADIQWRYYLTQPGEWLANATWRDVATLEELVGIFHASFKGVVLYDPAVPATSCLASTAAGVEDLLPVCYRPGEPASVYSRLVAGGPRLPVALNLTGMFASTPGATAKIAAYRWARARWLSPDSSHPQANPAKLGYYVDYWSAAHGDALGAAPGLTQVSNHDYFIAHRAFFFDLSVWADETPNDDPHQPLGADKAEMVAIFAACYAATRAPGYTGPRMLHVGGFTPWWFKYTNEGPGCPHCTHGGVETEWETMGVIGAYNAFDDGDACCVGAMANAALFQHYPLPEQLAQNAKPTVASLKAKRLLNADGTVPPRNYAAYYAGDYDGTAWLYSQLLAKWHDPKRGKVPIGWSIDSELSLRFPVIYAYLYATRTANDYFMSGDSGAGYLNPTLLFPDPKTGRRGESNVTESGAPEWVAWNTRYYRQFDLSMTGFLINGNQGPLTNESLAMYDAFSPDGVVVDTQNDPMLTSRATVGAASCNAAGTPVMHHAADIDGDVDAVAAQFAAMVEQDRSVITGALRPGGAVAPGGKLKSPSGNVMLHVQLDGNVVLVRLADNRALWATDTVDRSGCGPDHCTTRLELTAVGGLQAVTANGTVVWTPPGVAAGAAAAQLALQDDCNLVLYADDAGTRRLWTSATTCGAAPQLRAPAPPPLFYVLRTILKPASYMVDVAEGIQNTVPDTTVVDPYTMALLIRCHAGTIDCKG